MLDRSFTEVDLRSMLERADGWRLAEAPGRWIIEARHRRRRWEVVVEPDRDTQSLVVVTAYKVE